MSCVCVFVLIMSSATETTQSIQGWEICFLHRRCPHKTFCGVFGAAAQFHWCGLPGVSRSYRVCFGASRGCWRVSMVFQINQLNHAGRWVIVAWYSQFSCQCHFLWQTKGAREGSTSPVSPRSSPPLLQTSDGQILSCLLLPATVVPNYLDIMDYSRIALSCVYFCCVALTLRCAYHANLMTRVILVGKLQIPYCQSQRSVQWRDWKVVLESAREYQWPRIAENIPWDAE